jgi:hypothetical protein
MIAGTVTAVDPRRGSATIQPDGELPPVPAPLRPGLNLGLGARVAFLIETDRLGSRRAVEVTAVPMVIDRY